MMRTRLLSNRTYASFNIIYAHGFARPRCARFSRYPLLHAVQKEGEHARDPVKVGQTSNGDDGQHSEDQGPRAKSKTRSSLIDWGLFVFGIPCGWYLQGYMRERRRAGQTVDPGDFVGYSVVKKEPVSSTCSVFTLKAATNAVVDVDGLAAEGHVTSVEFKQPQLQIARAYTCLPPEPDQPLDELRFLIRKERNGEVSNYLHRLPLQAEIEVRGPHVEYTLPKDVKSVVFLAGGTGIAPAMQVADILSGDADVHILWASRRREDCLGGLNDVLKDANTTGWWAPVRAFLSGAAASNSETRAPTDSTKGAIVAELDGLKRQSVPSSRYEASRMSVDYFVDEEGTVLRPWTVKAAIASANRSTSANGAGRNILFISGPPGFVSHWAGPKPWVDGVEVQGPVKGALSTLDLTGWDVVKL